MNVEFLATVAMIAPDPTSSSTHGGDGAQRRDRQSVCVHLMAICLLLETDRGPEARISLLREMTATKVDWPTLRRPPGIPSLNLQNAAAAVSVEDYSTRVDRWAHAVWEFWTPEHPRVRAFLGAALQGASPAARSSGGAGVAPVP